MNKIKSFFFKIHQHNIITIFLLSLSSLNFGIWFKNKQISIASQKLFSYYPISWYLQSYIVTILLFFVLYLLIFYFIRFIAPTQSKNNLLLKAAIPFLAFHFSLFDFHIKYQFLIFIFLVIIISIKEIFYSGNFFKKAKEPIISLLILCFVFLFFYRAMSPIYHQNFFLDTWGRNDHFLTMDRQWENAKAYDFIGNFTQKEKFGDYATAILSMSELDSLIVLLFDIPLVDLHSKYASLKFMIFFLYIFGSYGMFFFLRYGLELSFFPALTGALGFIFGNSIFLSYLGNEYFIHQGEYIFLPWTLFFLKIGYKKNNPGFLALAGLFIALPEYTMNSHPEVRIISYIFIYIYFCYLSIIFSINHKFKLKYLILIPMTFPLFHLVGMSYRFVHFFDLVIHNEFALYSPYTELGIWWNGTINQLSTFFFRYNETRQPGFSHLHANVNGAHVLFYTGQVINFFVFFFIIGIILKNAKYVYENRLLQIRGEGFFFVCFLFIWGYIAWWGNSTFISELSNWLKFGRLHYFTRFNIYFFFLANVVAMYGFHKMLELRKLSNFLLSFLIYSLILLIVFHNPVWTPSTPDSLNLDIVILYCILSFSIIYLYFKGKFKKIYSISILFIAFFSFLTLNFTTTQFLFPQHKTKYKHIFTSFKSAVHYYQGQQHDKASLEYLKKRWFQFQKDLKKYPLLASKIEGQFPKFIDSLEFYEKVAKYIDEFYLSIPEIYKFKNIPNNFKKINELPAINDYCSSTQYYLNAPKYSSILFGTKDSLPVFYANGNYIDVFSRFAYMTGAGIFPSIYTYYHVTHLYNLPKYKFPPCTSYDIDAIRSDSVRKLINITGIDYISYEKTEYPKYYYQLFKNYGYIPIDNIPENSNIRFFYNPNSYGKAYIAKQIRFLNPNENLNNAKGINYLKKWPYNQSLHRNFENHINKIPDKQNHFALIEKKQERTFIENDTKVADNKLIIKKIIASKAIFEVDCKQESCWIVYNVAALKGWKAFSYTKELPIYKANMGFIGVELKKGKHFLWMEYHPTSYYIGLFVTLLGWITSMGLLVLRKV